MDELEQTMTRYLLGELPEQEQAAFEKSYFKDAVVFDQLLQVENALVDAYARGQMSSELQEQFEQSYLKHPSRRERVEFARALTKRIDEREESRAPLKSTSNDSWLQRLVAIFGGASLRLRFSMALAAVVIVLMSVWIFVVYRRQQQQREAALIQSQRENQEPREREQTAQQQPTDTPPEIPQRSPSPTTPPSHATAFLALTAGGVRGSDSGPTPSLVIQHDTTQAQLLLKLKDDSYPNYRVSLQKIGGAEIFTQSNIKPRKTKTGASFIFTVPAGQLNSGEYALTLVGVTPEGDADNLSKSLFRVEKR